MKREPVPPSVRTCGTVSHKSFQNFTCDDTTEAASSSSHPRIARRYVKQNMDRCEHDAAIYQQATCAAVSAYAARQYLHRARLDDQLPRCHQLLLELNTHWDAESRALLQRLPEQLVTALEDEELHIDAGTLGLPNTRLHHGEDGSRNTAPR
jgi:hypothetical protein